MPIEDLDQPAHPRSLIRVFDGHSMGSKGSSDFVKFFVVVFFRRKTRTQIRMWGCETDLNLFWTHMSICTLMLLC